MKINPLTFGLNIFIDTHSGNSLHKLWYPSFEIVVVVDMQQCCTKAHAQMQQMDCVSTDKVDTEHI